MFGAGRREGREAGITTPAHGPVLGKIAWNLIGFSLPLVIAAVVVPRLLASIGSERFGLLALAWGLIGYASVLDLGIGRATTRQISALRGGARDREVPDVLATAIRLTTMTGGAGTALIALATLAGAYRLIHAESVPASELAYSMLLLALALPMQAISATYRGVNEAYLNFRAINILRIFLGVANFGAPYLVAQHTDRVHWLVATLVLSRAIALLFFRHVAYRRIRQEGHAGAGHYRGELARYLLRFGGWFSVSSLLSPLLVQLDRFLIGSLLSAAAVTVYVLPYELTVQMLVLSGSVTTVAFPLISNMLSAAPAQAALLFRTWLLRLALCMGVAMTVLAMVMPELLRLWLGGQLAPASVRVGQILCAGVFFNCIGAMHFSLLHAYGKTRQTALLHLCELPCYVGVLYFLIGRFGVAGAALAWVLRVGVDALALVLLARRERRRSLATTALQSRS